MTRFPILAAAALVPALLSAQSAEPGILPAPASTLPLKHAAQPTSAAITPADLMTRLYVFADDSMMGREAATRGNVMGTDYIAGEVKRLGLLPAGENGGYFQTLPFRTREVAPSSRLVIGGSVLDLGTEWAAMGNTSLAKQDLPVVYGGVFGENALPAEQMAGKLVVFDGSGPAARRALRGGAGAAAPTAAAVALVGMDNFMAYFLRPGSFLDQGTGTEGEGPLTLLVSTAAATRIFGAPLAQVSVGAAGGAATLDFQVSVEPVRFPARNVVALLPGSDPALNGQYVAIGAHNDHVGVNARPVDHDSLRLYNHIVRPGGAEDSRNQPSPSQQAEVNRQLAAWRTAHPNSARLDSIYNGADDDGSGSVSVLEIAESFARSAQKPRRSILFVWHVGEEKGLLGSAWFTDHPTVPRDSIVAQLNMDMVGRGNAWDVTGQSKAGEPLHGSDSYLQLVGSRRLSTELGDLVEEVNTSGRFGFTFDYGMDANGHPMNIYCRSDHYEYARYGIPITFFTTGGHSDYHQVTDEPQYIDYEHMAKVDRLVEAIARRVANLDHRIVVDAPKPDPAGRCQQ